MVTQEQLAALDLLIWLKTTEQAAQLAFSNQSTICRRTQTVLRQFGLKFERGPSGRRPAGDLELLDLERQVHQQARFRGHHPLRLHVPYWTRREALRDLPDGWCANPTLPDLVCDDPVTLLREHILDACLVTPTQLPARQDDLVLLELYRRPIQLILFPRPEDHLTDVRDRFCWQQENGRLNLRLLPFLPESCRQRSSNWFKALEAGPGSAPDRLRRLEPSGYAGQSLTVAFLTPEMRATQDLPWQVEETVQPYPYVEHLAVLAAYAAEPAVLRLQEQLVARFAPQASLTL